MLLDEMVSRATAEGLVAAGYELRSGPMPASPDKVMVLRETGGAAPEVAFGGDVVEQPGLQLVVRGVPHDYEGPRAVIEAFHQAVLGWGAFVADGTRYLALIPLQSPFPLRVDANERQELAVNYLAQKEPS